MMLLVPAAVTAMAVTVPVMRPIMRALWVVVPVVAMVTVMRERAERDECRQRRDIGVIVTGACRRTGQPQGEQSGNRHDAYPVYTRADHLSLHHCLKVTPI
jgi:hypothetical protein